MEIKIFKDVICEMWLFHGLLVNLNGILTSKKCWDANVHTFKKDHMNTQTQGSYPQLKEKGIRKGKFCQHLNFGSKNFRIVLLIKSTSL